MTSATRDFNFSDLQTTLEASRRLKLLNFVRSASSVLNVVSLAYGAGMRLLWKNSVGLYYIIREAGSKSIFPVIVP